MKRSVSIIFLLLANVFLLAHAVVPHHHDGPETCLISQAEAGAVVRHGDGFSLSAAAGVLTGSWESPLMEGEPETVAEA